MTVCKYCDGIGGAHKRNCPKPPDPIYCPAQTYRGSRLEPSEFCETEVADYGDFCSKHEEDDRADEAYERMRDARYDD